METAGVGAMMELSSCIKLKNNFLTEKSVVGCDWKRLGRLQVVGSDVGSRKKSGRVFCSSSKSESDPLTYKSAGVDIDAGSELVRRIAKMAPGIGGFGGLFPLGMFCSSIV